MSTISISTFPSRFRPPPGTRVLASQAFSGSLPSPCMASGRPSQADHFLTLPPTISVGTVGTRDLYIKKSIKSLTMRIFSIPILGINGPPEVSDVGFSRTAMDGHSLCQPLAVQDAGSDAWCDVIANARY